MRSNARSGCRSPAGRARRWCYSDLGLILAGRIVEQVTALGLADAFRRLVAEPLGLAARYGPIPAARAAASADSDAYEFGMVASGRPYPVPFTAGRFPGWRNHPLRGEVNDGNAAHALGGVAGHAGLFATVGDLLRLGAAVRGGDFIPAPVLARFADPRRRPSRAGGRLPPGPRPARRRRPHRAVPRRLHRHLFRLRARGRASSSPGGAMRLYGTLGPIPADGRQADVSHLVAGADIQSVLLEAALRASAHASTHATTAEEL